MSEHFADRLIRAIEEKNAPCVVGLDPSLDLMPAEFLQREQSKQKAEILLSFNKLVIDQIADHVPAVKPNSAFFERYGSAGVRALEETCRYARSKGLMIILDVKRGEIGPSSECYAKGYLSTDTEEAKLYDAITVSPYMGDDSLQPFVNHAKQFNRGVFILVKTSNPGSALFQDLSVGDKKVYEIVAQLVAKWSGESLGTRGYGAVCGVVGATWPEHTRSLRAQSLRAQSLRAQMPKTFLLVPGYGVQGGALEAVKACFNRDKLGAIINSSRAVLYPPGTEPIEKRIRAAALNFVSDVRQAVGLN